MIKIKRRSSSLLAALLTGVFALVSLTSLHAAEVMITDAYAREMPPGMVNTAIYLTLKNTSDQSVVLTGVSSGSATQVMIHQNELQGDMLRMRPVGQLEIAAHGQFTFAPGGHHLMVMGLSQPLRRGEKIALTFQFEDEQLIKVAIPVVGHDGGHGSDGSHSMQMDMNMKVQN